MAATSSGPLRVLVAGGGVAGLETLLAMRHLAGDRIEPTLLTPEEEFVYRPMAVAEPFARGHAQRHRLDAIAQDLGARLVRGSLATVDDRSRTAVTSTGERLSYDALVVAIGARSEPALAARLDVDARERRRDLWRPAARYRGGLHQARRVRDPGRRRLAAARLRARPDDRLGGAETLASTTCRSRSTRRKARRWRSSGPRPPRPLLEDLDEVGIQVRTSAYVTAARDGKLLVEPGARPLDAERVVALPRAVGPALPGVLNDARGFIRCDPYGKVYDTATVWAAGDAIAFPVKQGGLAAQQADAVAEEIAARAGADVRPQPFRPCCAASCSPDADKRGCATPPRAATATARRSDARCSGHRRRSPGAISRRISPSSTAHRPSARRRSPAASPSSSTSNTPCPPPSTRGTLAQRREEQFQGA